MNKKTLIGLLVCGLSWGCNIDGSLDKKELPPPKDATTDLSPDQGTDQSPDLNADLSPDLDDQTVDMPPKPPPILSGNDLSYQQDKLFECADPQAPAASPARLRLVDRYDWIRNTGRDRKSGASKNPFDALPTHQYSSYADDESISPSVLEIYMGMVGESAAPWKSNKWSGARTDTIIEALPQIKCFFDDADPAPTCTKTFARFVLEKGVLYRPASQPQVDRLEQFALNALAKEKQGGGDRTQTVKRVLSAAWLTSGALFRSEIPSGTPDEHGRIKLDDWQIAHALSHALGGRAPGAMGGPGTGAAGYLPQIATAAQDGNISDPSTIAQLVRLYVSGTDTDRKDLNYNVQRETLFGSKDDWRAKRGEYWMGEGTKRFFQEWLGYLHYLESFKDTPEATTTYDYNWPTPVSGWDRDRAAKRSSLRSAYGNARSGYYGNEPILFEQMDDMIARVLANDTDVFAQLLTTRDYYVPSDTNTYGGPGWWLYNLDQPPAQTREGRWVKMNSKDRAGVLTHPAWLASHSLAFENDPNPVHRGKWIREHLLCSDVPDVPITVEAALDPDTRDQSTRARVKQKTEQADCLGCHQLMNPLGYPFETYNHAGLLRVEDHGNPPDGSSELVLMPDPALNGPVKDAVEMSEKFAQSKWVKRCFIRQTFRYYMGREETMKDACALNAMEQAYDMNNGSFTEMLVALMSNDVFLYRTLDVEATR